MTNEERKNYYMNRNVKLYPTFLALTWDVIFVWTISTLFFTNQKGLSFSEVVMLDSFLTLFGCFFCLIAPKIFPKLSPMNTTRIGLLGYIIYLLLCMLGNSYFVFIIAQAFLAFGYALGAVKGNLIITEPLSMVKRDKDYQRVYGKGLSLYYIIEAVGAIVITYVYNWQPYAAYIISICIVIFVLLYSLLFKEPAKFQEKNVEIDARVETVKVDKKQKKSSSYAKILASGFVITLLVYVFFLRGSVSIVGSNFKMYLQNLIDGGFMPVWLFGYIYAAMRLCVSLSTKFQFRYDLRFGVRSLIISLITIIATFLINGLVVLMCPINIFTIIVVCISSIIQNMARMPLSIFVNNYIIVCTPKKDVEKLYALRTALEYLGYAICSFAFSMILSGFNDAYAPSNLLFIGIMAIPLILSTILFIRQLCKKYAQKYTIIKPEYTEDDYLDK